MKIIKAEFDNEEGLYVVGRRGGKCQPVLCRSFVSYYVKSDWKFPSEICIRISASRFKGASRVWIKIEHGDGVVWRRGRHTMWNPMFPAAQRRVRNLYPPGRSYTVRKLYYQIEALYRIEEL